MRELGLVRHGATEWSTLRHSGRTDLLLADALCEQAGARQDALSAELNVA